MTPEEIKTLEAVLEYLSLSTASRTVHAVYVPPAAAMREAADALEKKDKEIQAFKELVLSLKQRFPE